MIITITLVHCRILQSERQKPVIKKAKSKKEAWSLGLLGTGVIRDYYVVLLQFSRLMSHGNG